MSTALHVGFDKSEITPAEALHLDGYDARTSKAQSCLDPLYVRTISLQAGGASANILVLDALGASAKLTAAMRTRIDEMLPSPASLTVVAASHTHAGPAGLAEERDEPAIEEYKRRLIGVAAKSVAHARNRARPCAVRYGTAPTDGVAAHRTDPSTVVDTIVRVVSFTDQDDARLLGLLANYACHPTVLGPSNEAYSGDLIGRAAELVEAELGVPCVLTNGAEADISCRFTRMGRDSNALDELADKLAGAIGLAAKDTLLDEQRPAIPQLRTMTTTLAVTPRTLPSLSAAQEMVSSRRNELLSAKQQGAQDGRLRVAESRLEGAIALVREIKRQPEESHPWNGADTALEVDALEFGGITLLTVPGELENTTLPQRFIAAAERSFVIGLANGYHGYFAGPLAFQQQSYEALRSRFGPEVTTALCRWLIELSDRIRSPQASPSEGPGGLA